MTEVNTREDILADIQANLEVLNGDTISKYAVYLGAHLATAGEDLAGAERSYYQKWNSIRLHVKTNAQADNETRASDEYYNRRVLELRRDGLVEVIQALKKRLKYFEDELKNG